MPTLYSFIKNNDVVEKLAFYFIFLLMLVLTINCSITVKGDDKCLSSLQPGWPCIFPFIYTNQKTNTTKTYTNCTIDDLDEGCEKPWCATETNNETFVVKSWGYCAKECILDGR